MILRGLDLLRVAARAGKVLKIGRINFGRGCIEFTEAVGGRVKALCGEELINRLKCCE